MYNWEGCWTSDLENAKTGIDKYLQHIKTKKLLNNANYRKVTNE